MNKITIADIAAEAKVSLGTASRVINNKPFGYSEETRQRVLDAIKKLEYTPNILARSMITKHTNMVGIIIPDVMNPFYSGIIRGAEIVARENGINVMLFDTDMLLGKTENYIDTCIGTQADGIIVVAQPVADSSKKKLQDNNIPFIVIDSKVRSSDMSVILSDEKNGGYLATEHLIKLGHRNIACIESVTDRKEDALRTSGYIAAMKDYGIPINQDLIIEGDSSGQSGYRCMKELLHNHTDITAVFVQNDIMALMAYRAIKESGLSVPNDISVVGYDDISFGEMSDPPLTTIHQPFHEMGSSAMCMLIDAINGKNIESKTRTFPVDLIVRNSTKAFNI